ncbi:hypothetical protein ACFZCP_38385 [Streptomyces sp. NPDC007971]
MAAGRGVLMLLRLDSGAVGPAEHLDDRGVSDRALQAEQATLF